MHVPISTLLSVPTQEETYQNQCYKNKFCRFYITVDENLKSFTCKTKDHLPVSTTNLTLLIIFWLFILVLKCTGNPKVM